MSKDKELQDHSNKSWRSAFETLCGLGVIFIIIGAVFALASIRFSYETKLIWKFFGKPFWTFLGKPWTVPPEGEFIAWGVISISMGIGFFLISLGVRRASKLALAGAVILLLLYGFVTVTLFFEEELITIAIGAAILLFVSLLRLLSAFGSKTPLKKDT